MILLTGATGVIGGELLPVLLSAGHDVRALVRDPRRLGAERVNVQIALGDLSDPFSMRHAMRGVDTVIHLAAAIRDQRKGSIEELNGMGTMRLLRSAERAGVERFVFFSAMGASTFQRTRFFRTKALAERAVLESPLETTVFAPSIVYRPGDPWITLLERLSMLPAVPVSGSGRARYQPIWARDVANCVASSLNGAEGSRYELAGPETLSYDEIVEEVLRGERPGPAPGPRSPPARPCRPERTRAVRGHGGIRDVGGGRADGGADGKRGRHRGRRGPGRRAAPDGRRARRLGGRPALGGLQGPG